MSAVCTPLSMMQFDKICFLSNILLDEPIVRYRAFHFEAVKLNSSIIKASWFSSLHLCLIQIKRVSLYAEFLKHFAMVCILFKPKFESVWKLKRSRIEEKIQSRTARWKTTESHYREKYFLSNLAHKRKIEKLEMA